jgi:GNAT superfamily N-acetyltransferase
MKAQIRKAKPGEAELLSQLALESKAHWGYPSDFIEACIDELRVTAENLALDKFTYMVYESGIEILGFYAIEYLMDHNAALEALFVKPKEIGNGIGRSLMTHAIQLARSKGFTSLLIQSDPNAENFYLAAGAVLIGKQQSGSVAGRYLTVLRHDLKNAY